MAAVSKQRKVLNTEVCCFFKKSASKTGSVLTAFGFLKQASGPGRKQEPMKQRLGRTIGTRLWVTIPSWGAAQKRCARGISHISHSRAYSHPVLSNPVLPSSCHTSSGGSIWTRDRRVRGASGIRRRTSCTRKQQSEGARAFARSAL
jgi:hypothetical protein